MATPREKKNGLKANLLRLWPRDGPRLTGSLGYFVLSRYR
jgi:hypothetical protein